MRIYYLFHKYICASSLANQNKQTNNNNKVLCKGQDKKSGSDFSASKNNSWIFVESIS